MCDLAQRGMSCSSFLMVKTHIVGIAFGAPFSRRARYSPKVMQRNLPILLMPPFLHSSFEDRRHGQDEMWRGLVEGLGDTHGAG